MGIRVRKVDDSFGIWDSCNCEFVNPRYLCISRERIREYIKGDANTGIPPHPFPASKDNWYTEEYMIGDVTNSEGSLIIPGTEEQADWIADMIQALL